MIDSVLDAALDAVITIDGNGLVVELNRAAESMFGVERGAAVGMTAAELVIPPRYHAAHWAGLRRVVAGGPTRILGRRLEMPAQRANGDEFPVELTVTRSSEEPARFTAWIRDMTGSRALEAESARRAVLLARVEQISGSAGWEWTPSTGELLWSDNYFRLLGVAPGEITPSLEFLIERIHPDDRDHFNAALERRGTGRELGWVDYRIVRPDGEVRHLHVSVAVTETDPNGRERMLGSVRDVTEQAEMEARVDQLTRQESIGQLAGGIAHDFNNILAVITTNAEFAAAALGDESPARADVDEIHRAAERAAQLTRQLLVFSRRESVHPESLNLNEVISELEQMMRRSLGERVTLRTRPAENLWPVEIDRAQIDQILVNLAINARDAMPDGGELTMSTSNVELYRPRPGGEAGRFVSLTVSDTGGGMTEEVQRSAFEPFFTTKPLGRGTGLGLATVHGVVTKAGGDVRIDSAPGEGTTVTLHLPASSEDRAPVGSSSERPGKANGERVLVVEDEEAVRRATERILVKAGYRVLGAATPEAALEACEGAEPPFDLLLADVVLPSVLGTEVAQRALEIRPETRVLYMSGYAPETIDGFDPRPHSLVPKPFTAEGLLASVRTALDSGVSD